MIPQEPVDAIFVFAGRESRKRFGLELFREGRAEALVLSVGRFEWRRFEALGLPSDGGLVELVQKVEPAKRHFFVRVDSGGARAEAIARGKLGTWSEARALATFSEREGMGSLLLVSHRRHLPRCRLAARALLPPSRRVETIACPDAEEEAPVSAWGEAVKLPFYAGLAGVFWLQRAFRRAACADREFLV
jgi:hypothetical protein